MEYVQMTLDFVVQNWQWFAIGGGIFVVLLIVIISASAAKKRKRALTARQAREEQVQTKSEAQPTAEPIKTEEPVDDKESTQSDLGSEEQKPALQEQAVEQPQEEPQQEETQMAKPAKPTDKTKPATKSAAKPTTKTAPAKAPAKPMAKAAPAKTAPKAPAKEEKTAKAVGKWRIKEVMKGEYAAFLYASNGQLLLTSEVYASADGAKKGIDTISKNVALDKFEVHSDKNGHYYYKVKTSANRLLCVGETYSTEAKCLSSIESVKKFCASSVIVDAVEKDLTMTLYKIHDEVEVKKGYDGKWTVEQKGEEYMAKLFASNGELLVAGETFRSYESAKSNIDTIVQNALVGNFIIDRDKNGRYLFKLRSAQKSVLCVSETYATQAAVERAIESVRRFAKTAKLVD